jgi:hypothetical protein
MTNVAMTKTLFLFKPIIVVFFKLSDKDIIFLFKSNFSFSILIKIAFKN